MDALEAGGCVITANRRLAFALRQQYAAAQQARGLRVWPTPSVASLEDWLLERGQEWLAGGGSPQLLLSDAQERALWEAVIGADQDASDLLDLEATAAAAATAWHRWQHWRTPENESRAHWGQTDDTEAFRRWSVRLQERCRAQGWITAAELPHVLGAAWEHGDLPPGPAQLWVGFDELTPAQLRLRQSLAAVGTEIRDAASPPRDAQPHVYEAVDAEDEIRAAARWARHQIEVEGAQRVGVVVAGLEDRRASLERIFYQELHADRDPWDRRPPAFHISLGQPLAEAPVVAAALELLRAGWPEPLGWNAMAPWLRLPFVEGAETEAAARAALELDLRRREHTRLAASAFAARATGAACPLLARAWQRWRNLAPGSQPRTHTEWTQMIAAALDAAGWPGERPLDSAEFQGVESWHALLDSFATLDQVAAPLPFAGALERLRQMAGRRIFQLRHAAAPVEIMGWRQAGGQPFDAVWAMGLDDTSMPPPARPHPFLPPTWQRDHDLPHASPRYEEQSARRTWEGICQAAPTVMASWPRLDANGNTLRPSPLLAGLPASPSAAWSGSPGTSPALIEWVEDARAPAAAASEREAGVAVFADQSACPFRAFVHHRLAAQAPPAVEDWLSPSVRGRLLHAALCNLWQEFLRPPGAPLLSRRSVASLTEAEREARIQAAANGAVSTSLLAGRPQLAAIEHRRLEERLRTWIAHEIARDDFNVVALEQTVSGVPLGGLTLSLRVDRVDEIATGRLLIDYKSGAQQPDWDGERPQTPQLPLYAVSGAAGAPVSAVMLAQLRPDDTKVFCHELTSDELARWQSVLLNLGEQYLAGEAAIQPVDAGACEHCDLASVCRLYELAGTAEAAGDDEAGDEADEDD